MFTGIIEEVAEIKEITSDKLVIKSTLEELKIGDSIAVNGVCLTIVDLKKVDKLLEFSVNISTETLNKTNLKFLKSTHKVNLERPLKINGRLHGHIVTGHVDTIIQLQKIDKENFYFSLPDGDYEKYIVEKGSVALDGISLTVAKKFKDSFSVAVIPFTLNNTNLKFRKVGDYINLEVDILAKYVENILKKNKGSNIDLDFLKQHGFA